MAPKRKPWERRRARGTGTIQRQRDGSYIARTADRARSGRFPQGSAGYRAAEEALERWNKALSAGRDPNDSRMRLRDFLEIWLRDVCKPPRIQAATREFYARHAGYATKYIGDIPLELLSEKDIDHALGRIAADGLSPRGVNHVKAVLRNALNVAKRWRLIADNPTLYVPDWPIDEEQGRVLTPEQVSALLDAVATDRLSALYHTALILGLRRGELLALRWIDVDFDAGILHVIQTVKEGEGRRIEVGIVKSRKARQLPLTPGVAAVLRARQSEDAAESRIAQQRAAERAAQAGAPTPLVRWNPGGLVFPSEAGTLIQPSNLNRRFTALSRKLGFSVAPHDMRRTALTDLAAVGEAKAVQNIAGHADIETTMHLYAGRRMGAMRAAVEAVEKARKTG